MAGEAINLANKLASFSQHWSPRVVAEMNDGMPSNIVLKVVKLQGDFVWHAHADTDELFLVLRGEMTIGLREPQGEREVALREGELYVVPRGVEHITRARQECHALIVEPRGVVNTGASGGALTAANDVWA